MEIMQSNEITVKLDRSSEDQDNHRSLLIAGLVIFAWLYANAASLPWFGNGLAQMSGFNLVLLSAVMIALSAWLVLQKSRLGLTVLPVMRSQPLIVMFGSALIAIALQWFIDFEAISLLLFAIGTYGLCGLWLSSSAWRKGWPVALLLAGTLPFVTQFGNGLGFPVRVLTANTVEHLLSRWQITAISSHDIIVLENGIAYVDLPCSGLKSLWIGLLFLLGATWIEGRKLGLRWFLVAIASFMILIAANISRVMLLVIITLVLNQHQLGDILHVPLGVLGFVSACAIAWGLLQTVPKYQAPKLDPTDPNLGNLQEVSAKSSYSRISLLIVGMLLLTLIPRHPLQVDLPISPDSLLSTSSQIQFQPIPLMAIETEFFANGANAIAKKEQFTSGNLSGSLLLVSSTSWRAHHAPELCFTGNGFKVDTMQQRLITNLPIRWLSLQQGTKSATYWFQSQHHTTDDFLNRIWSEITRQQKSWVMVSILFNQSRSADDPEIAALISNIHTAIDHSLNRHIINHENSI
jgi:exosortase O